MTTEIPFIELPPVSNTATVQQVGNGDFGGQRRERIQVRNVWPLQCSSCEAQAWAVHGV